MTLTIQSVRAEQIDEKAKAIMRFEQARKELVLNRTNAEALKLMWGPETNDWIGKHVTLYPAVIKDPFGDGEITAIRVRGSPEIAKPMNATVQRGRKTIRVSVQPTGQAKKPSNGKNAAPAKKAPAEPEIDPLTGEVVPADAGVFPGEDGQL